MRLFTLFLTTTVLCGCALNDTTPNFQQQALSEREHAASWSAPDRTGPRVERPDQQRELDALVGEALQANPNLQQTMLSVQIYEHSGDRRSAHNSLATIWDSAAVTPNTGQLQQQLDCELAAGPVAEPQRSQSRGGHGCSATTAAYQAAQDTLAAQVMTAWLGLTAQQQTIAIQKKRIALASNEQFIIQRYHQWHRQPR